MNDLQSAAVSRRLFAFVTDLILASILIAGVYLLLSAILRPNRYNARYQEILTDYEARYNVSFDTTQEQFDEMDEAGKANYREAVNAMNADEDANRAIRTSYRLTFLIFISGILLAMLILEFLIPLWLGDGRTLGKRLFGLGVMRRNGIRVGSASLFVRAVIGKGVLEVIFPVLILLTAISGMTGIFGIVLLAALMVAQIAVYIRSRAGVLLHDLLSDTVVIDWASQRIFRDETERDAYLQEQKEAAEERRIY